MVMRIVLSVAVALLGLGAVGADALTLGPDFDSDYTATSLGSVPGLPALYGGLTFLDSNTILIGGNANTASGRIYQIDVTRDGTGHITGFSGSATLYPGVGSGIGEFNDGGVVFGPGGVLFLARWNVNELGQVKPGSTDEDKIITNVIPGAITSISAQNFVPAGFDGAGQMKLVTWSGGQWYTATATPDGSGTFNVTGLTQVDVDPLTVAVDNLPGGPEGFVYIPAGNAGFSSNSLLLSEFSAGEIGAYELDANGNPLLNTRRDFLTGLTGAEGAAIDPETGDFLFSTFGGGNQVVVVQGFLPPPPPPPPNGVPEPATLLLLGGGALGLALRARAYRRR